MLFHFHLSLSWAFTTLRREDTTERIQAIIQEIPSIVKHIQGIPNIFWGVLE